MTRYNAPGELLPYTDRKLQSVEYVPPPIEDIVRVQQLDCDGKSIDDIAGATGLHYEDIRHILNAEPAERKAETSSVGYSRNKRR